MRSDADGYGLSIASMGGRITLTSPAAARSGIDAHGGAGEVGNEVGDGAVCLVGEEQCGLPTVTEVEDDRGWNRFSEIQMIDVWNPTVDPTLVDFAALHATFLRHQAFKCQ